MRVSPQELELHSEAGMIPEMDQLEYDQFLTDVRERGVVVPLEVIPGTKTIIDGRTRLRAAKDAGLTSVPVVHAVMGDESPALYMLRAAAMRRHLSSSQRAALALEIRDRKSVEAKERQRQSGGDRKSSLARIGFGNISGTDSDSRLSGPAVGLGEARAQAAVEAGTNPHYVSDAAKIKKQDPRLFEKVKAGKVSIPEAKKEIERTKPQPPKHPDDPPLDPRFMPNAAEAAALAHVMRTWTARLVALRKELRKVFPDRDAIMARRIDVGHTDAALTEVIETLDRNLPEHVCPTCCGTGADAAGKADKYCDGYGVVDRHHHAGLQAKWKHTRARYQALLEEAGG